MDGALLPEHGTERQAFRQQIMESARAVAEATGGFFALGNKISKPERLVITELEQTMSYTVRMWALPENLGESVRPET